MQTFTDAAEIDLEPYRRELTAYCYRMLGSGFEAEDAVQETMVRAWKNIGGFEGRSALRSWLYRIATNVCLDMQRGPQRRARPMDLGPASTASATLDAGLPEESWIQPVHDGKVLPGDGDPAEVAAERESIRLAFVAALQHLPAKQRAVLILREVLRWQATEVAELLDTTVPAVNSALQRARATLADAGIDERSKADVDPAQQELLERYVQAFEAYDMTAMVELLHHDVTFSMPPYQLWLQGPHEVVAWMQGKGAGCEGAKLLTTSANGCPAVAIYKRDPEGGYFAFNLAVLETSDGRITAVNNFLYPELFPAFGLPTHLD